MNLRQITKKHYRRLVLEGVLRSALFGLFVGFTVNTLFGALVWLFGFGGIWLAVGVGAGCALASGVLIYFLRYRVTEKELARRVDRLGLEERTVTMLELGTDDSYMAVAQRNNALFHISNAQNKKIKIIIPRLLASLALAAFVLGSTVTTVVGIALTDDGYEPPLVQKEPEVYPFEVFYEVEEGGEIIGEAEQLVFPGEDATPVVAVADDGWVFVGWDDGNESPERVELGVTMNMFFVAVFEEIVESEGGESGDSQDGQPGSGEGDEAEDVPGGGGANADSDQNGGQGDKGDASGSSGDSDGGKGSSDEQGEGKGDGQGQGAGGMWQDSNQFIDGEKYYKDYLDYYYEYALEIFKENGEIPPELRDFFEAYFDSI